MVPLIVYGKQMSKSQLSFLTFQDFVMDAAVFLSSLPANKRENNDKNDSTNTYKIENMICRLCLSTKAKLNLFDSGSELVDKIKSCCLLEIQTNDGLPDHICTSCMDTLQIVSTFQTRCHESDKILRTRVESVEQGCVKLELKYDEPNDDAIVEPNSPYIKEEIETNEELIFSDSVKVKKIKKKKRGEKKREKNGIKDKTNSNNKKPKSKIDHESKLCTICGKCFKRAGAYHSHVRMMHMPKKFACTECPKVFYSMARLKDHLVTHFAVKNVPCDECGKLFTCKAYVQKHVDKIHKRKRTRDCHICMKKLMDTASLKIHLKTHTGEKDYKCDICTRYFASNYGLQLHLRIHSGEKPYSCPYCFKKFSSKKSSTDHELLHTGETPYKCPVCSKGFAQLSNMKSHFRYNHKGKDLKDYPSYKKRDNQPLKPLDVL